MDQPIINSPIEKAKLKTNWWPMWFGLAAFLLGPVLGIVMNIAKNNAGSGDENATASAVNLGLPAAILSVVGIIIAAVALKRGPRSVGVWAGLVLSILAFGYYAYIAIGESIG